MRFLKPCRGGCDVENIQECSSTVPGRSCAGQQTWVLKMISSSTVKSSSGSSCRAFWAPLAGSVGDPFFPFWQHSRNLWDWSSVEHGRAPGWRRPPPNSYRGRATPEHLAEPKLFFLLNKAKVFILLNRAEAFILLNNAKACTDHSAPHTQDRWIHKCICV